MLSKLFVYGTLQLQSGHPMARLLHSQADTLGPATTPGLLFHCGAYPAAVPDPNAGNLIHGTLCEMGYPDRLLPVLDRYEGFLPKNPSRSLFVRIEVEVDFEGQKHMVWMYCYNKSTKGLRPIPGGDYLAQ